MVLPVSVYFASLFLHVGLTFAREIAHLHNDAAVEIGMLARTTMIRNHHRPHRTSSHRQGRGHWKIHKGWRGDQHRREASFAQGFARHGHEPADGQLGPELEGYCEDANGGAVDLMYRHVPNKEDCWRRCMENESCNGAAFHFDTSRCIEYVGDARIANGYKGFACRIKNNGRVSKPACADTCPDDLVPTCSTYKSFVSPGGCAENCSTAVKVEYHGYVCGHKPVCAASCPEDIVPTCADYDRFAGPGGCAAACDDNIKFHFQVELCGFPKPACATTCPAMESVPSCATYKNYISEGGCAENCNDNTKLQIQTYMCMNKPLCVATCPDDVAPTCSNYEDFVSAGGCAENCSDSIKLSFKPELCPFQTPTCAQTCPEMDAVPTCSTWKTFVNERSGCAKNCDADYKAQIQKFVCGNKPLCAASCPENVEPTCAMHDKFVGPGGCAESCSDAVKFTFKNELCGFEKPECASSCPDMDAVPTCSTYKTFLGHGGCASSCTDFVKSQLQQYVCGNKPLCAASCPEDIEMNCGMYDYFVGVGGCAESCSTAIKEEFRSEICNPNSVHSWSKKAHVWGAPPSKSRVPNTIEKAEAEITKLDSIVASAEAEAGIPDSTRTSPAPEAAESEEEKVSALQQVAIALACLCCCWCVCCIGVAWAYNRRSSKEKGLWQAEEPVVDTGADEVEKETLF